MHHQPNTALVFTTDYRPGVPLRRVGWIQQPTVNRILQGELDWQPGVSFAIDDPTNWNGFIYRYEGCGHGDYNLTFLQEEVLREDQTYQWGNEAVVFSDGLQLLETRVETGGDGGSTQTPTE